MHNMRDITASARRIAGWSIIGFMLVFLLAGVADADTCRIGDLNISPCYPPDKVHRVPVPGTLALIALPVWWLIRRKR